MLDVDADGIFVSSDPVAGEWFAGFGVGCLLPPRGETDGRVLVGRVAGDEVVLVSRRRGMLDSTVPTLRRVETSNMTRLQEAARAAFPEDLSGEVGAEFSRAVRAALPEPAEPVPDPLPPRAEPGQVFEGPLPEGAPLLAWAPPDALAVRFRSVEAAFRFASFADELAARLAAGAGDGRDFGTLRLTLHHLLLPSIWRANPGGETGVDECALIVVPLRAGRMRAAVVFRVIDYELHDHETRAGVALEARPEHLWRPDADPFPEERVRSGVRAWVGDCEIVATDEDLLDQLLAGPGRQPTGDWSQDAIAARFELPPPSRRRALSLAAAVGAVRDATSARVREAAGARQLASRWLGLAVASAVPSAATPLPIAAPWDGVIALTADTDARGALIHVRTSDEGAAQALAERLRGPPDLSRWAFACHSNLRELTSLGIVEPRATDVAERAFVWLGWRPVCPERGVYRFHPATGVPSCSVHGDGADGASVGPGVAESPITDVTVDGSLVTFRLSIDW